MCGITCRMFPLWGWISRTLAAHISHWQTLQKAYFNQKDSRSLYSITAQMIWSHSMFLGETLRMPHSYVALDSSRYWEKNVDFLQHVHFIVEIAVCNSHLLWQWNWTDGQHQSDSLNHYRGPCWESSLDAHTCCHKFWFSFLAVKCSRFHLLVTIFVCLTWPKHYS